MASTSIVQTSKRVEDLKYIEIGAFKLGFARVNQDVNFKESTAMAEGLGRPLTTEDVEEMTKDRGGYALLYEELKEFGLAWMGDERAIIEDGFDVNGVHRWAGPGPRMLGVNYTGRNVVDLIACRDANSLATVVLFVGPMPGTKDYSAVDNSIQKPENQEVKKNLLRGWWSRLNR